MSIWSGVFAEDVVAHLRDSDYDDGESTEREDSDTSEGNGDRESSLTPSIPGSSDHHWDSIWNSTTGG